MRKLLRKVRFSFGGVISVIALLISIATYCREQSHWSSVNLARVVLVGAHFAGWKAIPRAEFEHKNWGYGQNDAVVQ